METKEDTMSPRIVWNDTPQRQYRAFAVECPECGAEPWYPCSDDEGATTLRGVHLARDRAYNQFQHVPLVDDKSGWKRP